MDETLDDKRGRIDVPLPSSYLALDQVRQRVVDALDDVPLGQGERGFITWGLLMWDVPTLEHFEQLIWRLRNFGL
jgi:hypothetical protein